jgi:carbonic anhydrase
MARSLLRTIAAGLQLSAGFLQAQSAEHWSYTGSSGPKSWGTLEKDYAACGQGKSQSPIDIRDDAAKPTDLPAIQFDYRTVPLKIIDNGHSIQVNYAPGSSITLDGQRYELVQFHFHKPSEEKINGRQYPMVAHLVHKNQRGQLAVIAVLLATGPSNPLIKTLWANIPNRKEAEAEVPAVTINAADLLPGNRTYYTFTGSLTTPPCTEGVRWLVLRNPTSVSENEVARFGDFYPMDARPVQALNGREIDVSK